MISTDIYLFTKLLQRAKEVDVAVPLLLSLWAACYSCVSEHGRTYGFDLVDHSISDSQPELAIHATPSRIR